MALYERAGSQDYTVTLSQKKEIQIQLRVLPYFYYESSLFKTHELGFNKSYKMKISVIVHESNCHVIILITKST